MRTSYRAGHHTFTLNATKVLRADPRPPVLFLRSYQDDAEAARPARPGAFTSVEEAVADVVGGLGPFIGLDLVRSAPGAARGRVRADADWRTAVLVLMLRCGLVVLRCGTGDSLFWELRQAVALLHPEQLIILVPADPARYAEFRRRTAGILPHPLPADAADAPARQRIASVITFAYGWHPTVVSLRFRFPWTLPALDTRLGLRLTPVLKLLGYRRRRHWVRRAEIAGMLIVVGWMAVRFAGIIHDFADFWRDNGFP